MPTLRLAVVVLLHLCSAAQAGQGASLLRYVPHEVDLVVALDVAKARSTPLFDMALQLAASLGQNRDVSAIDWARDIDTAVLAMHVEPGDASHVVMVLEGRLTSLHALAAASKPIDRDGLVVRASGELAFFALEKRFVVCSAKLLDVVIATVQGKHPAVRASRSAKMLRDARASLDKRAEMWALMRGSVIRGGGGMTDGIEWLALSITGSRAVALEVRLGSSSETSASEISSFIEAQLPTLRQLLGAQGYESLADSIEVRNTGATIGVSALMSEGEVAQVQAMMSRHVTSEPAAKSP